MIQSSVSNDRFIAFHHEDAALVTRENFGGLEVHRDPSAARDLSTYAEDGSYRFIRAEVNLKRGWVMTLNSTEDLRMALDLFYPAALGLFVAMHDGSLEVENLRDKLQRQTGMYRVARTIHNDDAQRIVRETCGPSNRCAKRILWSIDADTPLDDSDASRFPGFPGDTPENEVIPLLCREACNHFVAECCRAVKKAKS